MRTLALVVLIGSALVLTSCSATQPTPKEFATVTHLRDAFIAAGGTCDPWSEGDAIGPWAQYGNCGEFGAEDEAVLSIYTSEGDREASVQGVKDSKPAHMVQMLVGPNWIIQAADVEPYIAELGGTLVAAG